MVRGKSGTSEPMLMIGFCAFFSPSPTRTSRAINATQMMICVDKRTPRFGAGVRVFCSSVMTFSYLHGTPLPRGAPEGDNKGTGVRVYFLFLSSSSIRAMYSSFDTGD